MVNGTGRFESFHQILFWPLELIRESSNWTLAEEARSILERDGNPWEKLDHLGRQTTNQQNTPYQEFVYFHPFAQRFLYADSQFAESMYILRRTDVGAVRVKFETDPVTSETLKVLRVHLYLFRTQIAILVVEVCSEGPLTRDSVLRLENEFRRIYPPYWYPGSAPAHAAAGQCPRLVEWLTPDGSPVPGASVSNYCEDAQLSSSVYLPNPRPPVSAHWNWLRGAIAPVEQIVDDRAPAMVFLRHANPPEITRGDLVRHCFYDGPSETPWLLPYSEDFLANFESRHAYTRFWNDDPKSDNPLKTLYLCCGYGFTVIAQPGFMADILLEHFRHHYFQIGLLAHFHRASLLRFSSRFNEVMLDHPGRHHAKLRAVRKDFATFISTSWFHEVSNQDQGKELFELWTRQLGSEKLMKDILAEADAVDDVLSAHHQEQINQRIDTLTVLLYVAAALTVAVAIVDTEAVKTLVKLTEDPARGVRLSGGIVAGLCCLLTGLYKGVEGWKWKSATTWVMGILFVIAAVCFFSGS